LYGTDARFTQAVGLELNQDGTQGLNSGQRFYHLAFPQFYVDAAVGRLKVRTGHWYTIMGYESVMSPVNFFYSHAYTMQYGEPFTHTGVLGSLSLGENDGLVLYGGIHNGWDIFSVANTAPAFTDRGSLIGGLTWKVMDGLIYGAGTYTLGNELNNVGTFPGMASFYQQRDLSSNYLGVKLTEKIEWLGQLDLGDQIGGSRAVAGQRAEWYGAISYLFISLTETLRFGARGEWFRDDDGARVRAVGDANLAQGPFVGNFYEATLGLNWAPNPNIMVRPEMRWDWFGASTTVPPAVNLPLNAGQSNSQWTAAVDAIMLW
jgi:hypothetical protein